MIDLSGQWEIEKWSVRWLQALSLLLLLQSGSPDSSQILTAKDSKALWKNHTKEVFYTYMVTIGAASDLSAHDITHNM